MDEMERALAEALKEHGMKSKVARACDVSPQSVSDWKRCPPARVLTVSDVTGVPPHVLRPDMYRPPQPTEPA